jgi:hypothetical protein
MPVNKGLLISAAIANGLQGFLDAREKGDLQRQKQAVSQISQQVKAAQLQNLYGVGRQQDAEYAQFVASNPDVLKGIVADREGSEWRAKTSEQEYLQSLVGTSVSQKTASSLIDQETQKALEQTAVTDQARSEADHQKFVTTIQQLGLGGTPPTEWVPRILDKLTNGTLEEKGIIRNTLGITSKAELAELSGTQAGEESQSEIDARAEQKNYYKSQGLLAEARAATQTDVQAYYKAKVDQLAMISTTDFKILTELGVPPESFPETGLYKDLDFPAFEALKLEKEKTHRYFEVPGPDGSTQILGVDPSTNESEWVTAPELSTAPVEVGGAKPVEVGGYKKVRPFRKIQWAVEVYDEAIAGSAKEHGIEPNLLKALIYAESAGDPEAESKIPGRDVGAKGLTQLMPATAQEVGVTDITDPDQQIEGGAVYLGKMLDRYGGDMAKAIAAYNAGPGRVPVEGELNLSDMPSETRKYVPKVMGLFNHWQGEGVGVEAEVAEPIEEEVLSWKVPPKGASATDIMSAERSMMTKWGSRTLVKGWEVINMQWSTALVAYDKSKNTGSHTFVDQALINIFNKMLDYKSVVRSSEYARTAYDKSLWNRLEGKLQSWLDGGNMSKGDRKALMRMCSGFHEAMRKEYISDFRKLGKTVDSWNQDLLAGSDHTMSAERIALWEEPKSSTAMDYDFYTGQKTTGWKRSPTGKGGAIEVTPEEEAIFDKDLGIQL